MDLKTSTSTLKLKNYTLTDIKRTIMLTRNLVSLQEQQTRETNLYTEVLQSDHQFVYYERSAFELFAVQPNSVRFDDA